MKYLTRENAVNKVFCSAVGKEVNKILWEHRMKDRFDKVIVRLYTSYHLEITTFQGRLITNYYALLLN